MAVEDIHGLRSLRYSHRTKFGQLERVRCKDFAEIHAFLTAFHEFFLACYTATRRQQSTARSSMARYSISSEARLTA